jgi:hypothetical protein
VIRRFLLGIFVVIALTGAWTTVSFSRQGDRRVVIRPRPPIYRVRPYFPIYPPLRLEDLRVPYFSFGLGSGLNGVWWPRCGLVFTWDYDCGRSPVYLPVYIYGEANVQRPQLALKDGTVYGVTDYWLVNGQLHFRVMEEGATKSVEHVIDFSQLDFQETLDLDTVRGFRFVLRNEPLEDYLRDHPATGAPAVQPRQ